MPKKSDTVVYLCGGINGLSDNQANDWRQIAKRSLPLQFLDPMVRDYRGMEDSNVNQIVEQDLVDIKNSNIILVNATRPSWGTAMEIVYAKQLGKMVVSFVEGSRVSPWLRYHSDVVVNTLDEANAEIVKAVWP